MKPVMQDRFGYPAGNCWEAAIASVLEIPLEEVPDGRRDGGDRLDWYAMSRWLAETHGFALLWMDFPRLCGGHAAPRGSFHYILDGVAKNGLYHSVVARSGRVVHNPNPNPEATLVSVTGAELFFPIETGVGELPTGEAPSHEEMAEITAKMEADHAD